MTAEPMERASSARGHLAHDPMSVRAALDAHADTGTLHLFDQQVSTAWEASDAADSLDPLREVVERWWIVADAAANGPAHEERRISRAQAIAAWETRNGQPFRAAG